MAAVATTAICMLSLVTRVNGNVFLGAQHRASESPMMVQEVKLEIDSSESLLLAHSPAMTHLQEELEALFSTMPKNEAGKLDAAAVRYVLHRYFAQKHGWHVEGLYHAGRAWNASSPTTILKDNLPAYLEEHFEAVVMNVGLGLPELAVLANTLSGLIQSEAVKELAYIYDAMGVKGHEVSLSEIKRLLKSFLVAKIWGIEEEGIPSENLKHGELKLEQEYLEWPQTKLWASDLLETFDLIHREKRNPFREGLLTFDEAVEVVTDLNHRHSSFHFLQCRSVKDKLMQLEHQGTGRVPLSKFYSGSHREDWQFVEKAEYLRSIGVLDESNPKFPSVIIPNYLLSPSNCIGTSSFYSLCCQDECEDLLAQVEQRVGEPLAAPHHIIQIVSMLESDSVSAPRNLSVVHSSRLDDIAAHHGGMVPLHGRLFAQWLHHLFPRECPFPQVGGSTNHLSPDDWAYEMGLEDVHETEAEMRKHVLHMWSMESAQAAGADSLPWAAVEELVSVHKLERGSNMRQTWWGPIRKLALVSVALSLVFSLSGGMRAASPPEGKRQTHLV